MAVFHREFSQSLVSLFDDEYSDVLAGLDDLEETVGRLSFSGAALAANQTRKIEKAVVFFRKKLRHHMALDEHVIFPYLHIHMPRLQGILELLRSDRREFDMNFEKLEGLFRQFKKETDAGRQQKVTTQLKEKGIYLICLMRNHILLEVESVYKTIDHELLTEEKRELINKCLKFRMGFS